MAEDCNVSVNELEGETDQQGMNKGHHKEKRTESEATKVWHLPAEQQEGTGRGGAGSITPRTSGQAGWLVSFRVTTYPHHIHTGAIYQDGIFCN